MSDVVDFRGGDFRGPVTGKAEYRQQAPAPTALDALPPPAAGFTGRDEELGRLRAALDPSGPGGEQAVLVTAVSGLGGIGKTALAVQAAYAAREAGWFPGGRALRGPARLRRRSGHGGPGVAVPAAGAGCGA